MARFKIIGAIWFLICIGPALTFPPRVWSMAADTHNRIASDSNGVLFWLSQILTEAFFILVVLMGLGLFRRQRWAAICGRFVAVIAALVSLWFLGSQGLQH